jgi:hypothetical protein
MTDLSITSLLKQMDDAHLPIFAVRLMDWLIADLNQSEESVPDFTESRAKALLRAAGVVDDPTLHDFARLVGSGHTAVRLALHDLLQTTGLAANEEIIALANSVSSLQSPISDPTPWLALSIAAHAWKSGYALHQLDPASPPGEYSPAGQLIKRAATFLRQQIQRSATERDKLARKLAYAPDDGTPTLETMSNEQPIAPVPPHFRPPIPVNYPEVARETVQINENDRTAEPATAVTRTPPLTITNDDLPAEQQRPVRMPQIHIRADQVPARRPSPPAQPRPRPNNGGGNLRTAVRQRFSRDKEPLKSSKLRVIVQDVQDGPGLYGIQVQVHCQGIKAHVAGTTNRDGMFLCELPVRVRSGLTYDVDITWPRDLGGEVERKSVTLNVDRTEFKLPFFRRLS